MIEVIRLDRVDELLIDYKQMKNAGESFSDFIRVSKCIEENEKPLFDWELVEEGDLEEVREEE